MVIRERVCVRTYTLQHTHMHLVSNYIGRVPTLFIHLKHCSKGEEEEEEEEEDEEEEEEEKEEGEEEEEKEEGEEEEEKRRKKRKKEKVFIFMVKLLLPFSFLSIKKK